jgi:hypothetical protein
VRAAKRNSDSSMSSPLFLSRKACLCLFFSITIPIHHARFPLLMSEKIL